MNTRLLRAAATAALTLAAAPAFAQGSPSFALGEPGVMAVKAPAPSTGQEVYKQVCAACHMQNAMGGSGAAAIPSLAGNPRLAAAAYPITMVVKGRGAMPGFTDLLKPAQIAAVVAYVRTNFGNSYAKPVTEAEVAAIEGSGR